MKMKKLCKKEWLVIAFGAGCVLVCCCPAVWVTRILAIIVIILGFLCCRR